jgi:hypothetical protein
MTTECLDRRRLAKKVAESIAAISAIKKSQESGWKKDASLSVAWIKRGPHSGVPKRLFPITLKSMGA